MKRITTYLYMLLAFLAACRSKSPTEETETTQEVQTPVTLTGITTEPLIEYTELNATARFLQKSYIKANVNGYVETVNINLGQYVREGQLLFILKTKEASAIGNAINRLDPTFKFSGVNYIKASGHGYINEMDHQKGDYVQDGEQLAVLNDKASFAFIMDMPYELKPFVMKQSKVTLRLPDETSLAGTITGTMPMVDSTAQTQLVIIKVDGEQTIPENLVARVKIIKQEHFNAVSLPKSAVLTNDVQDEFWVMKMTDSVTAVKVDVKKGMETAEKVEILFPHFEVSDRFLLTGNFGLPDTAKVKVLQHE